MLNVEKHILPAIAAGVDLGPSFEELLAQHGTTVAAKSAATAAYNALGPKPMAGDLIQRGTDAVAAAEAQADYEKREADAKLAKSAAYERATRLALTVLPRIARENADAIIEGSLRERWTELLAETRKIMAPLEEFAADDFDASHIAHHATPAQLKAFQAAAAGQDAYTALRTLARELVNAAAKNHSNIRALRRDDTRHDHPSLLVAAWVRDLPPRSPRELVAAEADRVAAQRPISARQERKEMFA